MSMESYARTMLQLPFRRTHPISLSVAIRQYISTKYDQHPEMFVNDLAAIDQLRADAVNVREPHVSGIKRLQTYAAQLRWIGGKFPIDVGVDFPWYPALGFNTSSPGKVDHAPTRSLADAGTESQNNVRFELANILFNLSALYTQLAYSTNRSTGDGLKTAASYLSAAAGVLFFLRTNVIPDMRSSPPEDMDDMTLESLQEMCLAQAQECFWTKSVKDDMKDGTIARLAAKLSDYYSQASDFSIKSDAISTEWIHHLEAKHHHFAAAAQYRQSRDCLEKRKYGEEVSRLRDCIACVNQALKASRFVNKDIVGDLNSLKTRASADLKRAEKDNDMIYLQAIPSKQELRIIERANMVAAKPPNEIAESMSMVGDGLLFGPPLFAKLVPYAVHIAANIYNERRDRLIGQSIIADLEAMTARLRELLQSLNLPGSLQALEKPLGIPPSLVSKAEELRQQDGIHRIQKTMEDTAKVRANDKGVFQEGAELLRAEKAEDDYARSKYGTDRWRRPPSDVAAKDLFSKMTEVEGYLRSAENSDRIVQDKLRKADKILRVLTSSNKVIESHVPSSRQATITPQVERESSRLRNCLQEASRLESRRKRKIEALQDKAKSDNINPALLQETGRLEREFPMQKIEAAQFEDLFEQRLQQYDVDKDMLVREQDDQDQIVSRIRDVNAAFLDARKGDHSTKDREQALQELETGYVKYKEIVSNLDVGRKFYNDLAGIVNRFRENCKAYVHQRRAEASDLEADMANAAMSSMSLSQTSAALQSQKIQDNNRPPPPSSSLGREPLTAPMPTRASMQPNVGGMWSPDMGIKFSDPSTTARSNANAAPYPQSNGFRNT